MGGIQYSESPEALMKRLMKATVAGVEAAGERYEEEFLPEHFRAGNSERYHLQPRAGEDEPAFIASARGIVVAGGKSKYGSTRVKPNPKYFWRKYREGYGKTPLVRTGETEKMALGGARTSAKIAAGGMVEGVVRVPVPPYIFKYRQGQPDKASEISRTIPAEEAILASVVERTVRDMMERAGRASSVRAA